MQTLATALPGWLGVRTRSCCRAQQMRAISISISVVKTFAVLQACSKLHTGACSECDPSHVAISSLVRDIVGMVRPVTTGEQSHG